jgi:hypothetical protein
MADDLAEILIRRWRIGLLARKKSRREPAFSNRWSG